MHYHIIMKTKLKDKSVLHKNTFKQDNSFGVKWKTIVLFSVIKQNGECITVGKENDLG